MIRAGEEIHFVALLNEKGETLVTVPMDEPIECPERATDVAVDVKVRLTLGGKAKR